MAAIDEIMQILYKCHAEDEFEDKSKDSSDLQRLRKSQRRVEKKNLEEIKSNVEKLLSDTCCCYTGSVEYSSLNKMLAVCNLELGNELIAIHYLIESHAVIFRQHVMHRYQKTQLREIYREESQTYGLKPTHMKFDTKFVDNAESLKSKLKELPKEWYMIQITAQYESPSVLKYGKFTSSEMHAIHITVLPTGSSDIEPLCITLPKPDMTEVSYDVCKEVHKLLGNNKSELQATYANYEEYWKMRKNQNNKMKVAIEALEKIWLREWRILFMADPIENLDIVKEIHEMIDKLISDFKPSVKISQRCRWLLKKVSVGACFLTREEIARAIKFLIPNKKLASNIILSIYGKLSYIKELENTKRKTLVLIIEEHLDYLAFEAMEIIKCHPTTRFSCLHVAYALFKEHEDTIVDGCKVIEAKDDMGICVVNPSGDLNKMEQRLKLFMNFWLPKWKSTYNKKPDEEMFEDALVNHDILMYNGHGSGIQYVSGEDIEKMRVRSTVLLFGCNSVKLLVIGGRYPPYGVSNQYLIACSPCLLGMLWEVTDADIDKMTANFISSWIPSSSEKSWAEVDVNSWLSGTLKLTENTKKEEIKLESEMLRAVANAKQTCSQYMTTAAIVVRGLPIKII